MKRHWAFFLLLASCHSTTEVQTPKTESTATPAKDTTTEDAAKLAKEAMAPPKPHLFLPNQDGTVLDAENGQLWQGADRSKVNWDEANQYCLNDKSGGKTGWRLPTVDELRVLYYSADEPHFPECSAGQSDQQKIHHPKAIYLSCYQYWAKDADGEVNAYFMDNDKFVFRSGKDVPYSVICVHDK